MGIFSTDLFWRGDMTQCEGGAPEATGRPVRAARNFSINPVNLTVNGVFGAGPNSLAAGVVKGHVNLSFTKKICFARFGPLTVC